MSIVLFVLALELVATVWLALDRAYQRTQARPWSARWTIVTNPEDDTAFWIDTWGEHDDIEFIKNASVPPGTMYLIPKDWQPEFRMDFSAEQLWTPSVDPNWRLSMQLQSPILPSKPDPKGLLGIVGST